MLRFCNRYLERKWVSDAMFVSLPPNVERCTVYRNVVSVEEEGRIYNELSRVLPKYGDVVLQEHYINHNDYNNNDKNNNNNSNHNNSNNTRGVRHTYLEMYGHDKDFVEVKNWQKRETRRLPGLSWSPTLLHFLHDMSAAGVYNGELPDMARVVEYMQAGYEMHVEHPSCGSSFVYLNLLADAVFEFDDESTRRHGQVWLPARSLMVISHELRWGFRFGEVAEPTHTFTSVGGKRVKEVETDVRLGIQLWKFSVNLIDRCLLEEELELNLKAMKTREEMDAKLKQANELQSESHKQHHECVANDSSNKSRNTNVTDVHKAMDEAEAQEIVKELEENEPNIFASKEYYREEKEQEQQLSLEEGSDHDGSALLNDTSRTKQAALPHMAEQMQGNGLLGGDLNLGNASVSPVKSSKTTMEQMRSEFSKYKHKMNVMQEALHEVTEKQKTGEVLDDCWVKETVINMNKDTIAHDKINGFDPGNLQRTWDQAEAKAKFYKAKLRKMDYDGTAFLHSRMPDITHDAPMDMKATIEKIRPLIKDGKS